VGPVAESVQSEALAVPPLLLVTTLTSFRCAGSSSFVTVQVALPPSGTTTSEQLS
jgi:hypothetical protein